jgi:hypothetical protein
MVLSPIGGLGQIIMDGKTYSTVQYSTVQLLLVINYRSLWNALPRLIIRAVFVVLKRGGRMP